MSIACKLIYGGQAWSYVYLDSDGVLTEEDREHLVWNIVDMHVRGKETKNVKGETYEARITQGKYASLEGFCGQTFSAELETEKGRKKLAILLTRRIDPALN